MAQVAAVLGAPIKLGSPAVIQSRMQVHPYLDLGVGSRWQGRISGRRRQMQYGRKLRELANHHFAVDPETAHDGHAQNYYRDRCVAQCGTSVPLALRFWNCLLSRFLVLRLLARREKSKRK